MIPTIGVMIGFYIAVRMLQLVLPPGNRAEHSLVKLTAGFTIVVVVLAMGSLLATAQTPLR